MANKDRNRDNAGWQSENDELGRELDAALAKYAAVEPRQGLEERVLANLRAEQAQVPDRAWWQWSVIPAAAVAAVVVVALALAWRSGQPSHPVVASDPAAPTQAPKEPATQVVSIGAGNGVRPREHAAIPRTAANTSHRNQFVAANPKLDQFPSPHPLSEQETILKDYVAKYPKQAALIARAANEALRRDQLEEVQMQPFASGDPATDSEQPNNSTTDR